jgi:hypothetical protein
MIVCFLGLVVAATNLVGVESTASKSWPLFRGDPQSTGTSSATLPNDLKEAWRFEVKDGAFEGTAAIVNGTVWLLPRCGTG